MQTYTIRWDSCEKVTRQEFTQVEFCGHCGTRLIKACPHCGKRIRKAPEYFCCRCGKQIHDRPNGPERELLVRLYGRCDESFPPPMEGKSETRNSKSETNPKHENQEQSDAAEMPREPEIAADAQRMAGDSHGTHPDGSGAGPLTWEYVMAHLPEPMPAEPMTDEVREACLRVGLAELDRLGVQTEEEHRVRRQAWARLRKIRRDRQEAADQAVREAQEEEKRQVEASAESAEMKAERAKFEAARKALERAQKEVASPPAEPDVSVAQTGQPVEGGQGAAGQGRQGQEKGDSGRPAALPVMAQPASVPEEEERPDPEWVAIRADVDRYFFRDGYLHVRRPIPARGDEKPYRIVKGDDEDMRQYRAVMAREGAWLSRHRNYRPR